MWEGRKSAWELRCFAGVMFWKCVGTRALMLPRLGRILRTTGLGFVIFVEQLDNFC